MQIPAFPLVISTTVNIHGSHSFNPISLSSSILIHNCDHINTHEPSYYRSTSLKLLSPMPFVKSRKIIWYKTQYIIFTINEELMVKGELAQSTLINGRRRDAENHTDAEL